MGKRAIILTIETTPLGGVPSLVSAAGRMLRTWGYDPLVTWTQSIWQEVSRLQRLRLAFGGDLPASQERSDHPCAIVPALPVPFWLSYFVPRYLFGDLIEFETPVIVASGSSHVALPLALRGIPYVLWVATLYEDELSARAQNGEAWAANVLNSLTWPLIKLQERFALKQATRILALSPYTQQRILQLAPQVQDRIETMLFPVDTSIFSPDATVQNNPQYGDYLLLVGRIGDRRKNVDLLIRAYAAAREQFPNLKLVLVGEEPGDITRRLVHELGLTDGIIFTGVISHEEMIRLYQGAKLFVLPSTQEGLGIVVLEAMACGTPVISTRCGGPESLIHEGETGKLVPINDVQAMAGGISDLLSQPDQLAVMRQTCVEFIETHCSYTAIERQMRQAFDTLPSVSGIAPAPSKGREFAAAAWAVIIVAAYVQHQLILHWDAVQSQIATPLLQRLQ